MLSVSKQLILCVFACFLTANCVNSQCNEEDHHPENGGYFFVGVAGESDTTNLDSAHGQKLPNATWAPGYYPYGESTVCSGPYCYGECSVAPGCPQYLDSHTCSILKFCPHENAGEEEVIYQLPHFEATESCDFSEAVEVGRMLTPSDPNEGCFEYAFEEDHELTEYYFASQVGCEQGQKVAVQINDFALTADQCAVIGLTTPRIRNCDCRLQIKPSTLGEPCRTAFSDSCQEVVQETDECCAEENCLSILENFTHPVGYETEISRRSECDNNMPGLCYNMDGVGTDTNGQGSTDCCAHQCTQCGTAASPYASWKPCTSLDSISKTGKCGFLSRYDAEAFECDFSACNQGDHWHTDGDAFKLADALFNPEELNNDPEPNPEPEEEMDMSSGAMKEVVGALIFTSASVFAFFTF